MRSHSEISFSTFKHTSSKLQLPRIYFGTGHSRGKGLRAMKYSKYGASTSNLSLASNTVDQNEPQPPRQGKQLPPMLTEHGSRTSPPTRSEEYLLEYASPPYTPPEFSTHSEEYLLEYASPPYTPPDFSNGYLPTLPHCQAYARFQQALQAVRREVDEVVRSSKSGGKLMCPRYKCRKRFANERGLTSHILSHNGSQDITLSTCRRCQGAYYAPTPEHLCDQNLKERDSNRRFFHKLKSTLNFA